MSELIELGFRAALIGTGTTLTMDLWTILLKRGLGVRTPDYGLVRLRSSATHGVFGIGLYGSEKALELLRPLSA